MLRFLVMEHYHPQSALEITELFRHTEAWETAKKIIREAMATGFEISELTERVTDALKDEIDIDEVIAGCEACGFPIPAEHRADARKYLAAHLVMAVAAEMDGKTLPILPMISGGVQVFTIEQDGMKVPVVMAVATPYTSEIATTFQDVCDRTFGAALGNHPNAVRDARWFRLSRAGIRWRDIARTDRDAGLPPEAFANPAEYPDEVRKAADRVRRAVGRYAQRWTKLVDSMSASEE